MKTKQLTLFPEKKQLKYIMYGPLSKVPNKKSWREAIHVNWDIQLKNEFNEMLSTYKSKTKKANME